MTAPLRFVIAVDAAWTASIDGGGIANVAPRPLGALDQGQPWEEALDAVADRKMKGANDVKAFGKTLFDLLVGVDWWREILAAAARAQTSQFELALSWPPDRFALTRLPWELMHDGVDYVCGRPDFDVAITRLVEPDAAGKPPRHILLRPPRMLFIIGTTYSDKGLRPGAECLGILRQIQAKGRTVHSLILERPSVDRIRDTVTSFKPDVVHVISHGAYDPVTRASYIKLVHDGSGQHEKAGVTTLRDCLVSRDFSPTIVILSACESGAPLRSYATTPLAGALVKAGIPVVLAMAGRVSDAACRLFTRKFGEALVEGEAVVWAAAHGRRAALRSDQLDGRRADWALLNVFLATDVASDLRAAEDVADSNFIEAAIKRDDVDLKPLLDRPRIPMFCGRHEVIEAFHDMLREDKSWRPGAPRDERPTAPVLALRARVLRDDEEKEVYKLGLSRLLVELSVHAIREGFVPLPLIDVKAAGGSRDLKQLMTVVAERITSTRRNYGLAFDASSMLNALVADDALAEAVKVGSPVTDEIRHELRSKRTVTPTAFKLALMADLDRLRTDVLATHAMVQRENGNVVLLIDDLDTYADAVVDFFDRVLDANGIGTKERRIPVVVAFYVGEGVAASPHLDALGQGAKVKNWLSIKEIEPFRKGDEQLLACQRVLLHPFRESPDAAKTAWALDLDAEKRAKWEDGFDEFLRGAPGMLEKARFFKLVRLAEGEFSYVADDESIVSKLAERKR